MFSKETFEVRRFYQHITQELRGLHFYVKRFVTYSGQEHLICKTERNR